MDRDPTLLQVTAVSLVRWAGVSEDGTPSNLPQNPDNLSLQLGIVQSWPLASQVKIYSEVIAKYMPALGEVFRRTSEVAVSPVGTLINAASTTPYFIRFLRSPAGEGLAALQAQRVAAVAQKNLNTPIDDIAEMGQFLASLLLLQGIEPVAAEDKEILLQYLPVWKYRFDGHLAGEVSERCIVLLTDDRNSHPMMGMVRNMLVGTLDKCGGPGCQRSVQRDGPVLQQCGRCKSAVYCGPAHQKAAWPAHKHTCFTPTF